MKIKIRNKSGKRIGWKEVILREIVTLISSVIYTIAYVVAIFHLTDNDLGAALLRRPKKQF